VRNKSRETFVDDYRVKTISEKIAVVQPPPYKNPFDSLQLPFSHNSYLAETKMATVNCCSPQRGWRSDLE